MFVFIIAVVVAFLYYMKYRHSRRHIYELANALPDAGGLPIIGHTHWFIGGSETLMNNIKTLGAVMAKIGGPTKLWIGPQLYVVPNDLDDVQKILENCLEKDYSYKFLKKWLGDGLFVAPVDIWKAHRRMLLPVFQNKITDEYIEVFGQQGAILVERFAELEGKEIDVYEYITSCMLDIVFEAAMGERMDVQHNPDTPYLVARKDVMAIISMRMFKPWMQPESLFNLTSYSKTHREGIDLTHRFTDKVVAKKRLAVNNGETILNKKGRKDLLELLLQNPTYTNTQLREHIDSITIAGNDTTALVISYALVMLGLHEKVQAKVYDEIKTIFGDSMRLPTKEDLNKMEYTERVLKETMRLYTVIPVIARYTQKELKLSTCTVPANVGCAVLPFTIHRNKKFWGEDADSFRPDRFLPENSVNRHPCAFIPFSYGSRNCIGRHFGMLAMKSVIANIVCSYEITSRPCDRFKLEILMFPVSGHQITLKKRSL